MTFHFDTAILTQEEDVGNAERIYLYNFTF
jgi:hypothetical protein